MCVAGTQGEYPFNTQFHGRRAIEKYAREVQLKNFSTAARVFGGTEAAKMAKIGTGQHSQFIASLPYDLCLIDAHRFDFIGSIAIPTPKGDQWIPIQRMQFIPVLDAHTSALFGYRVSIAKECRANDAMLAFHNALGVWKPRKLRLPGMTYHEDAGFPSSLISELEGCCWASVMLDNATIHYSVAVRERMRRRTGAAINWGPINLWIRRALVEGLFSALERTGFQRLPTTTGSGPHDSRRDDPEGNAIKHKMHWEEMLDLIDIICATYNITPRADLGYRSPIELLRDYVSHPLSSFLPRKLPSLPPCIPDFDVVVQIATIRGNVSEGRRPYVQLDGVHYTSGLLAQGGDLIGTSLTLHVDENDMRTVKAFLPGGAELGVLNALGSWGHIKHNRPIRKEINNLFSRKLLALGPGEEPIQAYLRLKANQAMQDTKGSKSRKAKVSRAATDLARAVDVTGEPVPEVDFGTSEKPNPTNTNSDHFRKPSPSFIKRVRHRGI